MPDRTETLFARVQDLAQAGAGENASAPIIEVDAPAWALREDAGRDRLAAGWGIALLIAAGALMAGLAALLIVALDNSHADTTIRDALAIAFAADVVLLALIGRSLLSKSDPRALLRVAVRRPSPSPAHDLPAEIAKAAAALVGSPPLAAAAPSPAATPAPSAPAPPAAPEAANPASALSSFIGREPVLIQGLVLVAGSLALAFGTDLGGGEVGGIAAAAAAALTLLTRTATTSIAKPTGAAGEPLTPAPPAAATAPAAANGAAPAATPAP